MKTEITPAVFAFNYTGNYLTEKDILSKDIKQLSGQELLRRISNKTITGDYLWGYKYITDIHENGTTEGINHVGSLNHGKWSIDLQKNTMTTQWDNGWIPTTTRAYFVNDEIHFFDEDTGEWRTSFKSFEDWK